MTALFCHSIASYSTLHLLQPVFCLPSYDGAGVSIHRKTVDVFDVQHGQQAEGALHSPLVTYSLGDVIKLLAPKAAGGWEIDRREYGDMQADVSVGRSRDGLDDWITLAKPTPGAPNSTLIIHPGPVPSAVVLQDNYPNPFNPETNLIFGLPVDQRVRIQVFDTRGRLVTTLVDEYMDGGFHPVKWNGTDARGRAAASGVYFARMESGGVTLTNSMTLVR